MSIKRYSRWILKLIVNHIQVKNFCWIVHTIFFISIFLILTGQPKVIFQSHLHIPWLTNVQHIQPLKCISDANQSEWPHHSGLNDSIENNNHLTVVIVTARSDFKSLPTTIISLICHLDSRRITEVLFLVPPDDVNLLEPYLSSENAKSYPWSIQIVSDDILLKHIHTNSYRLQMIFKLFLAQIIRTEYYLILDSDCLAIWPIHVEQLLYNEHQNLSLPKALYQIEGKLAHQTWWLESEELIQMKLEACVSTNPSESNTMGVTPSILSRTIALRTLCRLQKLYGDNKFLNKMANWALWRLLIGRMWTEYTLYYLTACCTKTFDQYHFHYNTLSSSNSLPKLNLYGFSIWSSNDWTEKNQNRLIDLIQSGLKRRQKENDEIYGQALIDKSIDIHSLFSVLQGKHYVNPKLYHQIFYPLYIQYLKKYNHTENLIKILDKMCEKFLFL